jgi:phosphatidylglycerophosphate synthase
MRTVPPPTPTLADRQQAAAAGLQAALLVGLTAAVGLGPVGWLAGVGYAVGLWVLLDAAARRAGVAALGPADLVTLTRAGLVGTVTALVADGLWTGSAPRATLVAVAVVALALDAVDGRVARRTGTVSALGARFDMEVDAFLVLVLSVHVAVLLDPWALAIGGMRYAFVVASWALPWLRAALPVRFSAKVVAAVQGIALLVATAQVLPVLAVGLVWCALGALLWSFGGSVTWLWRHARGGAPATPQAGEAGTVTP